MNVGIFIAILAGIGTVFIANSEDKKRRENINERDKNEKQLIRPLFASIITVSILIIFAIIFFS